MTQPTTYIPLKLLEYNVYDDINTTGDNYNKYKDNREFMVQMFGINQTGKTFSIFVEGFTPFFYIMVNDSWDNSKRVEFIKDIGIKMGQYYENSILSSKLIKRKKLYGFDAGKLHNFIHIVFKNTMALNKARKLWYKETITKYAYSKILRPEGYVFEGESTILYEGNIPPLLRLFHIKNISPSGWIGLPKGSYLRHANKSTYCDYEFTINYKHIIPLDKTTNVPYKQCSFDIEASSSHGDFPLAIKNYKKLATDIADTIAKIRDFDENTLQNMILTAFGIDVPETDISGNITLYRQTIHIVYPKKSHSTTEIIKMFNEWIQLIPATIKNNPDDDYYIEDLDEESDSDEDNDAEDEANEAETTNVHKSSGIKPITISKRYADKTATVIDMLKDPKCEYKMQVAELTKTLSIVFPSLEGDKITFIGSSFKRYGETVPYINHCIVLNGCDVPKNVDNPVIETYDTEEEVLMAWTRIIQRENPDIVIGYNINGFDFDFMDKRSRELNCRRNFLKLSRNREEVCLNRNWKTGKENIETTKIMLASGEYNLKFFKMTGRVIIDLYNYFRREYQLGSYKLDNVAGHFIGDDVVKFEHETNKTIIYSKNLKGLDVGSYIHFEEISYSTDYYRDGTKFAVEKVVMNNDGLLPYFVIDGHETLDMSKKVRWCIAKDDVSPQEIFKLANGDDHDRSIVAKYCIHDCTLVQDIMDKIDLLTDFSEMSNYCSVPTSFLVFRGQGIKLTSYIAKKCRDKDTLMPTIEKQENDGGYEGAIVLQPKSDMYLEDPVACVDYSSLYPSSIISENLSHDSKVWTKEYDLDDNLISEWGEKVQDHSYKYDNLPEYKYVDVVYDTYKYVRKTPKAALTKVKSGYKICRFAQFPDNQKAIMPSVLEELLSARKATKKLASQETDPFMKNILDKRQLTIKVTANSLYGQTGARTSTFYEKDVAASTTAIGRKLLIYGVKVIETAYKNREVVLKDGRKVKTDAEYVYGDSVAGYCPIYVKVNNKLEILTIEELGCKYGDNKWIIYNENGREEKEYCNLINTHNNSNNNTIILTWTDKGWTILKTIIRHRLAETKNMFRILTHTGLVDATSDHSLLTPECKEISPMEVSIGTELLHKTIDFTDMNLYEPDVQNISISEAKIYGFFFGDGSCGIYDCPSGKQCSWELNNKDINIIQKYLQLCNEVYNPLGLNFVFYDTIKSSNVYKISVNALETTQKYNFITDYRSKTYYKNSKIIPDFILNSSLKIREAFWEGLYDADVNVNVNVYKDKDIRIDQKTQLSASNICLLANSIGYKTSINIIHDIYRITCTKNDQRRNPNAIKKLMKIDFADPNAYVYDLTTENHHFAAGIGNMIVHNTDSVFFKFNLTDPETGAKIINREALGITIELAKEAGNLATKFLKRPHDLEYEKTFWPWCLLSKKRYVGMLYENDPDKGKIKFMGIVLKRRDNAPIVKDIYGGIIDIIMKERNVERTIEYVKTCLQNIVDEKYPMDKLIVAKALRGFYKNPNQIAHNVLANRIGDREQGNRPKSGDRIPYVYIVVENKKALQGEKIETPHFIIENQLKINYAFYITNQIMKPIQQLFALVLENMTGFKKKYGYTLRKWDDAKMKLREKWTEEEKYLKKYEELRCKEVKALLFDHYLNQLK